ncbi:hypothetical protein BDQ17DRAFT_1360196 [Cyathus striatus]|nr:hypothetical protein BDQ17DRAFT_1360196 [Cyathus striatus]
MFLFHSGESNVNISEGDEVTHSNETTSRVPVNNYRDNSLDTPLNNSTLRTSEHEQIESPSENIDPNIILNSFGLSGVGDGAPGDPHNNNGSQTTIPKVKFEVIACIYCGGLEFSKLFQEIQMNGTICTTSNSKKITELEFIQLDFDGMKHGTGYRMYHHFGLRVLVDTKSKNNIQPKQTTHSATQIKETQTDKNTASGSLNFTLGLNPQATIGGTGTKESSIATERAINTFNIFQSQRRDIEVLSYWSLVKMPSNSWLQI